MQKNFATRYPIETALEKLIDEVRRAVKAFAKFFFKIPKNKMDKYLWLIETTSWLLLTLAIILRSGRF